MIVLEGCDCAGKTTLAMELIKRMGFGLRRFERYGLLPAWWDYGRMYAVSCVRGAVIDRFVVSEFVYGRLWRGGPSGRLTVGNLEMIQCAMAEARALTVYVRPFVDVTVERMLRRGDEMTRATEVLEIYRMYDEYLGGATCAITRTPVLLLDTGDLQENVERIIEMYTRIGGFSPK